MPWNLRLKIPVLLAVCGCSLQNLLVAIEDGSCNSRTLILDNALWEWQREISERTARPSRSLAFCVPETATFPKGPKNSRALQTHRALRSPKSPSTLPLRLRTVLRSYSNHLLGRSLKFTGCHHTEHMGVDRNDCS